MRTMPSTYNAGDVNYDLHLHSSASDGALDPAALLSHAADCGVDVVSITECRPYSKSKSWKLVEVLERAEAQ